MGSLGAAQRLRPTGRRLFRRRLLRQAPFAVAGFRQADVSQPMQRAHRARPALADRRRKIPNARARRDPHRLEELFVTGPALRQPTVAAVGCRLAAGRPTPRRRLLSGGRRIAANRMTRPEVKLAMSPGDHQQRREGRGDVCAKNSGNALGERSGHKFEEYAGFAGLRSPAGGLSQRLELLSLPSSSP
jgi:hypothetical protein